MVADAIFQRSREIRAGLKTRLKFQEPRVGFLQLTWRPRS